MFHLHKSETYMNCRVNFSKDCYYLARLFFFYLARLFYLVNTLHVFHYFIILVRFFENIDVHFMRQGLS